MSKITCYILASDCLLVALDAHMFSHDGCGPGTKDQGLGARSFWALGLGPGPISIGTEHICIKGNHQAINRQHITGNLAYYMRYL